MANQRRGTTRATAPRADLNSVGELIRKGKDRLGWSSRQICDAAEALVGEPLFSEQDLSRYMNGRRPIANARHAYALFHILDLPWADKARFAELTDIAAFVTRTRRTTDDDSYASGNLMRSLTTTFKTLTDAVGQLWGLTWKNVFWQWGMGRLHHLVLDMEAACKRLERAARKVRALADIELSDLAGAVAIDTASAYHCAGHHEAAHRYALLARNIADALMEHTENLDDVRLRRLHMNKGRSFLVVQSVALDAGDVNMCWKLHADAAPWLESSIDCYGWAKGYHALSLVEFYLDNWTLSQALADLAVEWGERMTRFPGSGDLVWAIRDGLMFGMEWWLAQPQALQFDSYACGGTLLRVPDKEPRVPDCPPFVPMYSWVVDHHCGQANCNDVFDRWIKRAMAGRYVLYLPSMLISYGDYLWIAFNDKQRARAQYNKAEAMAATLRYPLLVAAAQRRQAGPPEGLFRAFGVAADRTGGRPISKSTRFIR